MNLADELKDKIGTRRLVKLPGLGGGGCINKGDTYEIDDGNKVFVKYCSKENADEMMFGEFESLKAIKTTNTVRVPVSMHVVSVPNTTDATLVMEYLDMKSLDNKALGLLGEQLAEMHLHNENVQKEFEYRGNYLGMSQNNSNVMYIEEFGFDAVTCCGSVPMVNDWQVDWVSFFARNRLDVQIRLAQDKYGDRQVGELWTELQLVIPQVL